jgi:hypothetical protein
MALLTRERLEQRRQRAYKEVDVPDPDPAAAGRGEKATIRLRAMFGGEWIDLIRSLKDNDWRQNNYTQLVLAFCLVDEQGKRILTDDDLNTAWWKTQSKGFLIESINAALDFSNLSTELTVEDTRKNLQGIGGSDSSTESPNGLGIAPPEIVSTTLD